MYLVSYFEPVEDCSPLHTGDGKATPQWTEHKDNTVVLFSTNTEGSSMVTSWFKFAWGEDSQIAGILCDWLQDHRDLLLSGAVGPNPAERLEQVIEWFRQHFERGSYAHTD